MGRLPCCVTSLLAPQHQTSTHGVTRCCLDAGHRLYKNSHNKPRKPPLRRYHRCVRSGSGPVAHTLLALQLTSRSRLMSTGFVPSSVSTVCVTRLATGGSSESSISVGWRTAQGFGLHASSGIGGRLLFFYGKGAVHEFLPAGGSEDLGRRGACRWC
ncbi:hypothetical protein KCP71_07765 [Salmonella enterica subsp. enterica]|nr:hypothetical protein KCP71_07765 [Salmonella enterica subsp. enterica]